MWLPLPFSRPVQGYFYPPDGWGRGQSPSDASPAALDTGWRGPDPQLDSGTQLSARGVEPASSGPSSAQLASAQRDFCVHSLGMILGPKLYSQLHSGTKSNRIGIKVGGALGLPV